ncbi:hypothetical protein ACFLW1_00140 [Chloroflexota bacterium]
MTEFKEKSISIEIDTARCTDCTTKACIEACQTYARGILQLVDGAPSVSHLGPEDVLRRGTECLACEYHCHQRGQQAINITIPIKGLEDFLAGQPLTGRA